MAQGGPRVMKLWPGRSARGEATSREERVPGLGEAGARGSDWASEAAEEAKGLLWKQEERQKSHEKYKEGE